MLQLGVRADMQADVGQRRRHGILEGESDLEEESNHRPYNNFKTAIVAMLLVKAIPYYGFHAVKYLTYIDLLKNDQFVQPSRFISLSH